MRSRVRLAVHRAQRLIQIHGRAFIAVPQALAGHFHVLFDVRGGVHVVNVFLHVPEQLFPGQKFRVPENHQVHRQVMVVEVLGNGIHRHGHGLVLGVSVSAGGNHGKGHRFAGIGRRQLQRMAVAGRQQLLFPAAPAVPDGAYRVDHVFGGQTVALGNLRFTRPAAPQGPAFPQQLRPGGMMDGPVHAASAQEGRIGRVYDGVHLHFRNIVSDDLKRHKGHPLLLCLSS